MSPLAARLTFAACIALAAGGTVSADGPTAGRDLVIDAAGTPIRVRVVVTIDSKPVEERRQALLASIIAAANANGDNRINRLEWQTALALVGLSPVGTGDFEGATPEYLTRFLEDRLGSLVEIVVQPQPLVDRLELFAALDADRDGFVTPAELADAERLLARYDADGDGTLNPPELAPTEPLQPSPVRSGEDFPPGRFPFRWERSAGKPDAVVEIKLIGRAFGRPKVEVSGGAVSGEKTDDHGTTHHSPLTITAEPRKASLDVAGVALDLDATPARITSEDVKRFYLIQLRQRDADKNGYLSEEEFLGLGLPGLGFASADANGDGMLFPDELRSRLDALIARETSRVRVEATYERQPLFTKLDLDGDGRLSRRELRGARDALASVDADGDGRIGLAEFGGRYRLAFGVPNLLDGATPRMLAEFEAMPRGPSPRAADGPAWFAAMDRNADGDLVRREFLGTAESFAALDADADGLLSPEEARAADEMQESVSRNEGGSGE
ncbi:MAG TPA: hypothetical protein VF170_02555 [Planctomycetaceae bacterium]